MCRLFRISRKATIYRRIHWKHTETLMECETANLAICRQSSKVLCLFFVTEVYNKIVTKVFCKLWCSKWWSFLNSGKIILLTRNDHWATVCITYMLLLQMVQINKNKNNLFMNNFGSPQKIDKVWMTQLSKHRINS